MPKPLTQHQDYLFPGYPGFDGASTPDISLLSRNAGFPDVPEFGRTMAGVYGYELYSPSLAITSATLRNQAQIAISPTDELGQWLQAANSQHPNATHSPISTKSSGGSLFRQGSPFAPAL